MTQAKDLAQLSQDNTAGKVMKTTGATMTGQLWMKGANVQWKKTDNSNGPSLAYDQNQGWHGFINSAGSAWTMRIDEGGSATFGQQIVGTYRLTMNGTGSGGSSGEVRLNNAANTLSTFLRAGGGGGLEFINNAYSATIASLSDTGAFTCQNGLIANGGGLIVNGGATFNNDQYCNAAIYMRRGGWSMALSADSSMNGGSIGFLNNGATQWNFSVSNAGDGNFAGSSSCHATMWLYRANSRSDFGIQNDGGGMFYQRGRSGGGYGWVNNAYSAEVAWLTDDGTFGGRAFNPYSDYRLKKNVVEMIPQDGLDRILALRPVDFTWIEGDKPDRGFLAHEVQAVDPLAASGEKDAVMPSPDGQSEVIMPQLLNHGTLVADLVAAIQALQIEIDELKAKLP